MKKIICLCFAFFISANLCHAFSDADLEKYQRGGSMERNEQGERGAKAQTNGNVAQEWCDKAQALDDRIEVAERNVLRTSSTSSTVTNVYGSRYVSASAVADAKQAADAARKELDDARTAKRRLEDNAHKQGVPPGWLRCQFK